MVTPASLFALGQYPQALAALRADTAYASRDFEASVLLTETLERLGDIDQAAKKAQWLLDRRELTDNLRARCLSVLGMIALEAGDIERSRHDFERAVALAAQSKAPSEACWAKLKLLVATAQGAQLADSIVSEVRRHVLRLGEIQTNIALHVFIAAIETQRGATVSAARHAHVASTLLGEDGNLWLKGLTEIDLLCLAFINGDFAKARSHGNLALRLSSQSGHLRTELAALSNLAHIDLAEGRLAEAERNLKRALNACRVSTISRVAVLDGLAQLEMSRKSLTECQAYLDRIAAVPSPDLRTRNCGAVSHRPASG